MPSIHLSNDWVPSMVTRLTSNGVSASGGTTAAQSSLLQPGFGYGNTSAGQLLIMKGTVPADFSTLTSINSRSSDILIRYTTGPYAGLPSMGDFVTAQFNVNPCNISTLYRAATASGTATWLWWVVVPLLASGSATNDAGGLYHQIIGTVGLPLSGADLEIPTTNIVSGEQYRIMNLRIQFPTTWNY